MFDLLATIGAELLKRIAELGALPAIVILICIAFFLGGILIAYFFWKELKAFRVAADAELKIIRDKTDIERKQYADTIVSLVREVVTAVKDNTESNKSIVSNVQVNNEITRSLKTTNDELIKTLITVRR